MRAPVLLLVWLLALAGCERQPGITPSGRDIVIEVIAPQSGQFNSYGLQALQGLEAGRSLQPLLPNGDRIVLRLHDDTSLPQRARELINDMDGQAPALLSLSGSDSVLIMAEAIERRALPTLAVIATHDDINRSSHYLTRLSMSNSVEAQIAASYIRDELYIDTLAVAYAADNSYSASLANSFAARFRAIGGTVAQMRSYAANTPATEAEPAPAGVQLLYSTLGATTLSALLESDRLPAMLFLSDGLLSDMQQHAPGALDLINGALIIDHFADDMPLDPAAARLVKYLKQHDSSPTGFPGLGYEAYLFLYNALSACRDYRRECINDQLRNSPPVQGLAATLQSVHGDMQRPVYVNRIRGKRMLQDVKVY
jgi:ABC-type branched-subunit amino acid transport system substrate-binding protein